MAAATKKKRKGEAYPWKAGASSRHITNLKQSILDFRCLWAQTSQTVQSILRTPKAGKADWKNRLTSKIDFMNSQFDTKYLLLGALYNQLKLQKESSLYHFPE